MLQVHNQYTACSQTWSIKGFRMVLFDYIFSVYTFCTLFDQRNPFVSEHIGRNSTARRASGGCGCHRARSLQGCEAGSRTSSNGETICWKYSSRERSEACSVPVIFLKYLDPWLLSTQLANVGRKDANPTEEPTFYRNKYFLQISITEFPSQMKHPKTSKNIQKCRKISKNLRFQSLHQPFFQLRMFFVRQRQTPSPGEDHHDDAEVNVKVQGHASEKRDETRRRGKETTPKSS